MMKRLLILLFAPVIIFFLFSCDGKKTVGEDQMPFVSVKTEPIVSGNIKGEISFTGSTVYLKNNQVISPISGYVVRVAVQFGQEVQKDMVLFELKTRENMALESGNSKSGGSGTIKILAGSDGFINELNINESGVYVAEGSVLCNMVNNNDLLVRLNIPFEYISLLSKEKNCKISLVDNTILRGSVYKILPTVDEMNQTQTVLIKPETGRRLPENLNVLISFVKEKHPMALLISKSSLMTNETQSEFWVMKLEEGKKAMKIPVVKGLENDSVVEIISTDLSVNDLIICQGAYGLPDSTIVSIVK